jgi:NhaP-type Na+/H+ or K+/H+ antiporter
MLSIIVTIFLVFCRKYTHFKGLKEEEDKHLLNAFINRLYFILTTITTIGYGDIVPASMRARIITICVILSIFVMILKVFDNFIDTYNKNIKSYLDYNNYTKYNPLNYFNNTKDEK